MNTREDVATLRIEEGVASRSSSRRYVWYAVALLTVVNAVNVMDRVALAVVAPYVKVDLHFSDTQLGLLTGFAFALFYAICGLPIARWADRGVRRNIIALALATWSVMTAISGTAQNFWHLLFARVGVGMGEAGSGPPAASIICDYVPVKRRSSAFSVYLVGNTVGLLAGMALAGWLAETIGWRWTFVVLGLPGIALALVVRFTLREPKRGAFDAPSGSNIRLRLGEIIAILWRCRTYRLILLLLGAHGFVQHGLILWWPSFYSRVFGLGLSSVGLYLGVTIGISTGIGVLLGGAIANKAAQRNVGLPLKVGAVATMLAIPSALASLFVSSTAASIFLVGLTGTLKAISVAPVTAAQFSVVTSHMRATAGAIGSFFVAVVGLGLGPLCVGLLSDLLAPSFGIQSLRYALLAPICLLPAMAAVLLAAAKSLPGDLKAAGAQIDGKSTIES